MLRGTRARVLNCVLRIPIPPRTAYYRYPVCASRALNPRSSLSIAELITASRRGLESTRLIRGEIISDKPHEGRYALARARVDYKRDKQKPGFFVGTQEGSKISADFSPSPCPYATPSIFRVCFQLAYRDARTCSYVRCRATHPDDTANDRHDEITRYKEQSRSQEGWRARTVAPRSNAARRSFLRSSIRRNLGALRDSPSTGSPRNL